MITIKRVAGYPRGVCTYQLAINNELVGTFTHDRSQGLSKCIEKAAKCADHEKWDVMFETLGTGFRS